MTGPDLPPADEARHTLAEVAQAVGLTPATVRRFWMALGLPDAGDEPGYSDADVAVLEALVAGRGGGVDLDTLVRLVRPVGQSVTRMSDWQVAALASRAAVLDGVGRAHPSGEVTRLAAGLHEALEAVLVHAWRRQVSGALARLGAEAGESPPETMTATVGFADLVKFSSLSNELDVNRLGDLVEIFESRCADVVAMHDGRLVKTLGDSVLFAAEAPLQATRIGLGLIDLVGGDARLPDLRIGLASGEVAVRMGDLFGPPVNLAARLVSVARRNRLVTDAPTAARLDPAAFELRKLSVRPLRGFGLVEPVAVRRA